MGGREPVEPANVRECSRWYHTRSSTDPSNVLSELGRVNAAIAERVRNLTELNTVSSTELIEHAFATLPKELPRDGLGLQGATPRVTASSIRASDPLHVRPAGSHYVPFARFSLSGIGPRTNRQVMRFTEETCASRTLIPTGRSRTPLVWSHHRWRSACRSIGGPTRHVLRPGSAGSQPGEMIRWKLILGDRELTASRPQEDTISTSLESLALSYLLSLLSLPADVFTHNTFTTGATASNILALATARDAVVARVQARRGHASWSVPEQGTAGVLVDVFVALAHASVAKSVSIVGIGRANVHDLADYDSAMPCDFRLDELERRLRSNQVNARGSVVVLSAGEVNTG